MEEGHGAQTGATSEFTSSMPSRYEPLRSSTKGNHSKNGLTSNKYAVACTLLASMNSILLGYDIGVTSGALLFIKEDLNIDEVQEEVLVSILSFVAIGSAAVAGILADYLGRRWTMAIAACFFFLGAVLMGVAPSYSILMVGRTLAGFGVGLAVMVAPVYTAELAPAGARGSLVSFSEIFINVGILLGYVSNYAFSGLHASLAWRVMLGVGILPALALAFGVSFMPESPRWLVMQGRINEARVVVIRTSCDAQEAEVRLKDIMEAAGFLVNDDEDHNVDSACDAMKYKRTGCDKNVSMWRELLFPTPEVRRMLIIACGIQFFQQATGVNSITYYSPEVFKSAGIVGNSGALGASVIMGCIKCLFILVATFNLDKVGRRPLLIVSTTGITISLAAIAMTFLYLISKGVNPMDGNDGGIIPSVAVFMIICVCSYVSFFSIGIGPICWVLTSEIFPLRLRAQAMSVGIVIGGMTSTVVSLTFLSMSRAITFAGTYFIFSVVSLFSVAFVYFCVPETKGRSLEEVTKLLSRAGPFNSIQMRSHALSEESEVKPYNENVLETSRLL